jgi:hypothetical protein
MLARPGTSVKTRREHPPVVLRVALMSVMLFDEPSRRIADDANRHPIAGI